MQNFFYAGDHNQNSSALLPQKFIQNVESWSICKGLNVLVFRRRVSIRRGCITLIYIPQTKGESRVHSYFIPIDDQKKAEERFKSIISLRVFECPLTVFGSSTVNNNSERHNFAWEPDKRINRFIKLIIQIELEISSDCSITNHLESLKFDAPAVALSRTIST